MKKILIVEDMKPIQKLLQTILENSSYSVTIANNGSEAQELIKENDFDLILLDIMMPVMDGVSFLKENFSKCAEKNIRVCMLTAKEENDSIQECLNYGAVDYVVKPINKNVLLEKVESIINNRPVVKSPSIKASLPLNVFSTGGESGGHLLYLFEDKAIIENKLNFNIDDIIQISSKLTKRVLGFELDIVCKVTAKKESSVMNGYVVRFIGFKESYAKKIRSFAFMGKEIVEKQSLGA